ncbi:hypothetical protein F5Y16DRAFT_31262 [Xylariaceae sp. FL0255]|nr:hypothetical protein F5Y16DRAFT_31262 [Xylariaceae sp. FL0255]
MRILDRGRLQWEFFVAIHPVFEQALPPKQLPVDIRADPRVQNDIAIIRQTIRAIPLVLSNIDLERDLEESKCSDFSTALLSLLEVFENLVGEDLTEPHNPQPVFAVPDEELELRTEYPKLAILQGMIKNLKSRTLSITSLDQSAPSGKLSNKSLAELAAYVDYIGLGKFRKYDSRQVATAISDFKSVIDNIFADPLEALERDLGNVDLLDDEISFIRRASYLSSRSRSLFAMLVKSIVCAEIHEARLHLSGFLDSDINFELLVTECKTSRWKFANCRLVGQRPDDPQRTYHSFCTRPQSTTAKSQSVRIAFDSEDMWDDETHESSTGHNLDSGSLLSLRDLLRFNGADDESDSESKVPEFVEEDKKIIELLVASSLLNLNASTWLSADLNIEKILVLATPALDRRWKPHFQCSLKPADPKDEVHDAILSFGLLLMEIEAKKPVRPKTVDQDWETGLTSKDIMLKRILVEWNRAVSDGYRHVATACLRFRELSAKFYNPAITQDMKSIAAVYKYILAPLHRLITTQHSRISALFNGLPNSLRNSSIAGYQHLDRPTSSPSLLLFDGSETYNPKDIKNASSFIEQTGSFRKMIEELGDSSTIPVWTPWRADKIRIAIIDTGIDDEDDNLIEFNRASGRIKDSCGFINDPNSKPDTKDYRDVNGHGTHVARLILEMAPAAELYIAKVSNDTSIQHTDLHRITRAIQWAHKDMHVNIISMSFGLEIYRDKDIDKAIQAAYNDNITMFAAAANSGGNKPRAYPSNRDTGVICVHASDGLGNDGGISPTPLENTDNFSTLGIAIASKWKGDDVLKSGTSFATPIAAALAADVLELARYKCDLDEDEQQYLYKFDGIRKILRLMAGKRHGYDYITPLNIWDDKKHIGREIYKIVGR